MISIFSLVLVFLALFGGLGLPLARRLRQPWPETLFAAFFLGWCAALVALQIWHLLLPVDALALLVAASVSVGSWFWKGRPLLAWLKARPRALLIVMTALAAGLLFLLVNQSLYAPGAYDHGLYHLPTVRWLQSYPIVPGLGNLHHRLAFNNSSLLVVALMDTGAQRGLIYYTATTLLFAALGLRGLLGAYRVAQGSPGLRDGLYTLLLPVVLWYVTRTEHTYAGYTTDNAIFFFQAVLAAELLHFFQQADQQAPCAERSAQGGLLILGLLVGLAVKFTFAAFGLGILLSMIWGWVLGERSTASKNRTALWRSIAIAAAVLLPWLARGALLSGYLLFPSTLLALPVRWRIPLDLARPVAIVIREWARTGGVVAPGQPFPEWLAWWWNQRNFEFKETWFYSLALLALVMALRRGQKMTHAERGCWALLGAVLASLAFWFWIAPAVRFASALPWLLPLIPALMLVQHARRAGWLQSPNAAYAVALFLLLLWLQPNFTNNITRAWLVMPPRESELATQKRVYDPARTQRTTSGLDVYIAADDFEERCFDQPLPCTRLHEFDPRLSLLHPGSLRGGFWLQPAGP